MSTKLRKQESSFAGPHAWNQLLHQLCSISHATAFRNTLKHTFLILRLSNFYPISFDIVLHIDLLHNCILAHCKHVCMYARNKHSGGCIRPTSVVAGGKWTQHAVTTGINYDITALLHTEVSSIVAFSPPVGWWKRYRTVEVPRELQSWQYSTESSTAHYQHAAASQSQSHRYEVILADHLHHCTADLTASDHDAQPAHSHIIQ